jgi:Uma2 family endonuclease
VTRDAVLVLEDNEERVDRFTATLRRVDPSLRLVVWRSARRMLGEMEELLPRACLISLDHDLEPDVGDPTDPGDGLDVARRLAERPPACPVVIHTSNGIRGDAMEGEFDLAGWTCRRVMPLGDDWIEADWYRVVRALLRRQGQPPSREGGRVFQRLEKVLFPPNDYPTSNGRPMAETDHHRKLMADLIDTLDRWFAADPDMYVSGNLLIFYEKGNKRRHVAPDVFVVFGVPKGLRPNYLLWQEKKTPDVVIELTSKTTRSEDTKKKRTLYEGKLKVQEYFLFDPFEDYLSPSFQGFRRVRGKFQPIDFVDRRLPSDLLRLHLERDASNLRLWDPHAKARLLTSAERVAAEKARADEQKARADQAAAEATREKARADQAEAEAERLRQELARLRRANG